MNKTELLWLNQPLVSILMTAYNRELYISESIESVLSNKYKNWELIIVDDHSTDKTVDIAKSFALKDDRIKVFVNPKNLGDYPNRNKAASYARGKYLKYVDSDDLIYPFAILQMVYFMEQNPSAALGLCARTKEQESEAPYPMLLSPKEFYKLSFIEKRNLHIGSPVFSIIRRQEFENLNGFINARHYCDQEFWLRCAAHYPTIIMPSGMVWMRTNSDGHQERKIGDNTIIDIKRGNVSRYHSLSTHSQLSFVDKIKVRLSFNWKYIKFSAKYLIKSGIKRWVQVHKIYIQKAF